MGRYNLCAAAIAALLLSFGLAGCSTTTGTSSQESSTSTTETQEITTVEQAQQAGWTRSAAIASSSMEPSLVTGDLVYGPSTDATQSRDGSFTGGTTEVQAGDIVYFTDPEVGGRSLIKRCVATAGQTVEITDAGSLIIDGETQSEAYTNGEPTYPLSSGITYPYTVPEGCIFVLGDNRTNSQDSRYFGAIDQSTVGMIAKKVLNTYTNQLEDIDLSPSDSTPKVKITGTTDSYQ